MHQQLRNPILLLTAIALLALGACSERAGLPLPGTLARERLELAAEASEPVLEWKVQEGDRVAAGAPLLQLDPARAQTAVEKARAVRDRAQRKVDELIRGPRRETIDELQARYDGAKLQLDTDEREYVRQQDLATKNLASPASVDLQLAARDRSRTAREAARAQLAAALKGTTVEELDQARASLAEAAAALRDAEVLLGRLTVVAPVAGVVDQLPFHPGERPALGQAVAVVLADSRVFARVYVPEPLRARVTAGLEATVLVDGIKTPFAAKVRFISADAAYTPYASLTEHDRSRLSYRAEVDLVMSAGADDPVRKLPSGVPVSVDLPTLHD